MIEQTRGYLKIKGQIFGLSDRNALYENQYTKKLRFIVKTDKFNSVLVTSKYWLDGNALSVGIRSKEDDTVVKLQKEDVNNKILESFSDGEFVFIKCLIDPYSYNNNVGVNLQLTGIYHTNDVDFYSNSFLEENRFEQTFVFNGVDGNVIHAIFIDYKGLGILFNEFKVFNEELLEELTKLENGDLVTCYGSINNVPILENDMVIGKSFYMKIEGIINIKNHAYNIEDICFDDEEIITSDELMPWE